MVYDKIKNILFLDIETVCCVPTYENLNERLKPLWLKKASYIDDSSDPKELFFEKGAIYAEFGKIISIGIGFFYRDPSGEIGLKIKGLKSHNELELLKEFSTLISEKFDKNRLKLCAHNGKEFDFPYLCRRLLVNNLPLPEVLNIGCKKPWEVNHLDTLEMWKFGDRKNYTSLELLAALFDIPGSKDDMDGSLVGRKYYEENDLEGISKYCCKDVAVTAQLYLRLNNLPLICESNITIVN
ncbi:MAG: 3'-5' exonuclease [Cytophagaceae bacterium]